MDPTDRRLTFYDKEDRPWRGRLSSAAIVGHTTTTSSRIWVRASQPGEYCFIVADQEIPTDGQPRLGADNVVETVRPTVTTPLTGILFMERRTLEFGSDITAVFDVSGLHPGFRYHYALFSLDEARPERWEVGRDAPLSFRTQKASPATVTFGLYSCHMPFKDRNLYNMHMWRNLREALDYSDADFVIGGGDQAYVDGDGSVDIWRWLTKVKDEIWALPPNRQIDVMQSWFRDIYRGYWADLEIRRVFRSLPNYMIWDDHEIMDGWGSYEEDELSDQLDTIWEWESKPKNLTLARRMFEAARRAYREYEHSHNPPTPSPVNKEQWDYTFDWGPLAFFVLDMRGHRNYERPKDKILGADQWKRLEAWFKGSSVHRAKAIFIVSPVPVVHLSDFVANTMDLTLLGLADDLRDEWEHKSNWDERNRLLDLVFAYSASSGKRVIFLSGDVHVASAFRLWRDGVRPARVYQLTSSGITYCKAPGRLLQLATRGNGELNDQRGAKTKTYIRRLQVFSENNFAMVHARVEREDVKVFWDVYGSSAEEDEVVKPRRVELE